MDLRNSAFPVAEKLFMETLDSACGRLQEKQAEFSIRRIERLDAILNDLETELNIILDKTAGAAKL